MLPVCVPCRKFYRPEKNGVTIEEGMPEGSCQPVTDESGWGPYKLWQADMLKCPGCGHEIITGWGRSHVAEHFQPNYTIWRKRLVPDLFVPDCC